MKMARHWSHELRVAHGGHGDVEKRRDWPMFVP